MGALLQVCGVVVWDIFNLRFGNWGVPLFVNRISHGGYTVREQDMGVGPLAPCYLLIKLAIGAGEIFPTFLTKKNDF